MNLARLLDEMRREHGENFVRWQEIPPKPPRFAPYPDTVHPALVEALRARGIDALWSHQAEAAGAALAGENVVVVTPTASGKTLCYNLPVLSTILRDPTARALYMFPTKALAQDQLDELHGLAGATGADIKTFTYDGDTSADARRAVREAGHIVITNPDMLHTGILPHHTKWRKLFASLKYIVIDELHTYRGVFGSHVANLIRRVRRVCHWYGADPVFILCSATIGNPAELGEAIITGRAPAPLGAATPSVHLVAESGAPAGKKVIAIYNPPIVNRELGIRRSSMAVARGLAGTFIRAGVQTIVFGSSRTSVELLLTYLQREVRHVPGQPEKVRGYRGGYLPNERRTIERGLREGAITGVVATNALELGIDIGGLEAAVLLGYPGSIASTWQQAGRAGRRHDLAVAIMVATSSPLNQYIAAHPEFIFSGRAEQALINPNNFDIRISHLKCAAFELPFSKREVEAEAFGPNTDMLLGELAEVGIVQYVDEPERAGDPDSGPKYHWTAEVYPAEGVSLRSSSVDNFVIIDIGEAGSTRGHRRGDARPAERTRGRVIGEIDRPSAPMLVHKSAIYFHGGRQYHVDELNRDERKAYVHPVDVDYYTDAELAVDLGVIQEDDAAEEHGAAWAQGEVKVSFRPTIFKKVKLDTHENVGWEKIDYPQEDMHTEACWLLLRPGLTVGMDADQVQGGLWGLGNLLQAVAPVFVLCDPRDVHVSAQVKAPHTDLPTVFLYDAAPGGVGLARRLFELRGALVRAAREHALACACEGGCPSCVGPLNEVAGNPKQAALTLLDRLTGKGASGAVQ